MAAALLYVYRESFSTCLYWYRASLSTLGFLSHLRGWFWDGCTVFLLVMLHFSYIYRLIFNVLTDPNLPFQNLWHFVRIRSALILDVPAVAAFSVGGSTEGGRGSGTAEPVMVCAVGYVGAFTLSPIGIPIHQADMGWFDCLYLTALVWCVWGTRLAAAMQALRSPNAWSAISVLGRVFIAILAKSDRENTEPQPLAGEAFHEPHFYDFNMFFGNVIAAVLKGLKIWVGRVGIPVRIKRAMRALFEWHQIKLRKALSSEHGARRPLTSAHLNPRFYHSQTPIA